jgi:lysophospholipid acyltransferase (LPLAT)-like uncharacterized protein
MGRRKKPPNRLVQGAAQFGMKLGGLLAAATVRAWMSSLDYKVAYYDPDVDPVNPGCQGHKIYVFWHEYILLPLHMRGYCDLAMLLSRHRDADILLEVARHMGFECVRGSSFRGGSTALRELERKSKDLHLAITPDGPRGPRRVLAQGPVYLSSWLGLPLVAMGFGYSNPWRLGSWDRFAIPKPYSRARAVVSPEMVIPPNLDRAGVEHYRLHVEGLLNRLTCEAEAWAAAGTPKASEVVAVQRPAWRRLHKEPASDPAHEALAAHLALPQARRLAS